MAKSAARGPGFRRSGASAPAAAFNFKTVLEQMVQQNASDLHLKVGRPPTLRVDGDLEPLDQPPLRPEDLKTLAEQLMTARQVKRVRGGEGVPTSRSACRASAASA